MNRLELVTLTVGDAQRLGSFFERNNVPAVTAFFHPFALTRETAGGLLAAAMLDRFFLGVRGDDPVAFSMLRGWDAGFAVPSLGMFVDVRWQGRGVGRRMLDATLLAAREAGGTAVRLSVYERNAAAFSLYMSRGFAEVARESTEHPDELGAKIVMRKDLAAGNA
jgi:GNAT superfamily N-acetyltransferase